ncbi:MAG: glycosyltransferase family 2 protein [Aggregatilineales bacterium]
MSQPLVSIVVPCYNTQSYVAEALDSALAQTYPNYELIIIDDGSTDNSPAILDRYAHQSPDRIRVIHQANQGVGQARMRAVHEAHGEFIVPLDADDRLHPDAIAAWMNYWTIHPHFALIYSPFYRIDAQGTVVAMIDFAGDRSGEPLEGHVLSTFLIGNVIQVMSLIRRDALLEVGGYVTNELNSRTGSEDYLLYLRLLAAGYEFGYVPRPLSYYRNTPESMSKDRGFMAESEIKVISYMMRHHSDAMSQAWYVGRQAREHHFYVTWQNWIREAEKRGQALADLDWRLQENTAERNQLQQTVQALTAQLAALRSHQS